MALQVSKNVCLNHTGSRAMPNLPIRPQLRHTHVRCALLTDRVKLGTTVRPTAGFHVVNATCKLQTARLTQRPHSLSSRLPPKAFMPVRYLRRHRSHAALSVEANLFARIFRVVSAYVSGFVGSYEDPEKLLDRATEEMSADLVKMRQATAQVMASGRQLEAKYKNTQNTADEWLRRAELAVSRGQDDLGREALRRRKGFQQTADSLKAQLDVQQKAVEQLTANMRMLESKLTEAKNKKDTLKARAAAAKSSKEIQEMVGGLRLNSSSAWAAFEKMEEKVIALEAEADSVGLLATPDSVEAKFLALEGGSVEDELSALKRGMAAQNTAQPTAAQQQLGRPIKEVLGDPELEYELAELRKRARS